MKTIVKTIVKTCGKHFTLPQRTVTFLALSLLSLAVLLTYTRWPLATVTARSYVAPLATTTACNDVWAATTTVGAPAGRTLHTAVWTGTEMIVWGGQGSGPHPDFPNTGGRYNPATDTWTPTSIIGAPAGRRYFTAVWTGTEMIVWGGQDSSFSSTNTGGRYNPATDTWTPTTTTNAPAARQDHSAIWTGTEMIVWGGGTGPGGSGNTGGRYNPATDTWTPTTTTNAPVSFEQTAVWTGTEMIIWGGFDGSVNTGGRYNPATDTWTAISTTSAPAGRIQHAAVWTGNEMIIWGGLNYTVRFNTGGRYNPATDSWTVTTTTNAPAARQLHTGVWTGTEMIIWGGFDSSFTELNTGGRYNPATDSWMTTSTTSAPAGRTHHTAVWTSSEMIVWAGGANFNTGGRYCVAPPVCVSPPSGLLSWWPGEGNANDIQGNNHGTLQGGATFVPGKVGQAFSFNGTDAYVRVPDNANLYPGAGSFTVDAWIKTTQMSEGSAYILTHYECANNCPSFVANSIYAIFVNGSGKLGGFLRDSAHNEQIITGAQVVADGVYHHIALVRDTTNSQMQLYVDGIVDASAPLTVTGTIKDDDSESDPFTIGAIIEGGTNHPAQLFAGEVDEVEYFNRALSASEIQAIVNAGSAGKCKTPANRPPVARCRNVTVAAGANCTASASIDDGSSDPDGDSLTLTQSPAGPYPVGMTNVMLMVTDGKGGSSTCSASVTVVDDTPPVIAPPPSLTRTNDPGLCSAVVPLLSPLVSDNCGIASVTNNAPAGNIFPVGTTIVEWTVTDVNRNRRGVLQAVTVTDNTPPTITACAANRTLSTNGSNQIALPSLVNEVTAFDNCTAASALTITQAPAAGTMVGLGNTTVTLTVKDAANNMSTCAAIVSVVRFRLGNFVAFSQEFTWLRANTKVHTGNVGANTSLPDPNGPPDDKEEIELGERVQMLQAGSSVVGDTVRLRANAQVYNVFYNELFNTNGDILGNKITPLLLPVLALPPLPTITPGTQDIEVQPNQTLTLAPGSYRKITVKTKGTLILTGGIYHVSSLDIRQEVKLLCKAPTEVRVRNEMDTDAKTFIGPDATAPSLTAAQIIFYVAGMDDQGRAHDGDENLTPTVVQIGERNTVLANFYAPNGTVWLKANTNGTGAFISKQVRIGERVELTLKSAF